MEDADLLNPLFTEDQVEKFATDYTKKLTEKLHEQIVIDVYENIDNWLYEFYNNSSNRIKQDVMRNFLGHAENKGYDGFEFADLRKKICLENLELFGKYVNDELLQENKNLKIRVEYLEQSLNNRY